MINLLYIILLTGFFLLVYISGKNNRKNLWCLCSGIFFTLGVVKEFFMFEFVPYLMEHTNLNIPLHTYQQIYSVMTWMLYVFAMSTAVIFMLNFSGLRERKPSLYRFAQLILLLCICVITYLYPPFTFRHHQISELSFWYILSSYNLLLGAVFICIAVQGVLNETNVRIRKQKFLMSVIIIPPITYWLITIFLIHPLRLSRYFHVWQFNIVIVLFCFSLYIYAAYKDGLMGLKLNIEQFPWDSDSETMNDSAQLTMHMLKNHLVKLRWCADNLSRYFPLDNDGAIPPEFEIIDHSLDSIQNYCEKTQRYTNSIALSESWTPVDELVADICSQNPYNNYTLHMGMSPVQLYCDPGLIKELLSNLVLNAADAILDTGKPGKITISDFYTSHGGYYCIQITDTGTGMEQEQLKRIFQPHYTTKNVNHHFGLGLPFCLKIMQKHSGKLDVQSIPGEGTTFLLYFPLKRVSVLENKNDL